LSLLF